MAQQQQSAAWGGRKMSSWADESEAAEAAEASGSTEEAFPSLSQAAAAKPSGVKKRNKGHTMTLSQLASGKFVGPGGKRFSSSSSSSIFTDSNRLTSEELMYLPTGPKERTAEELSDPRFGRGFRSYDGFRDRDREHFSRDRDPAPMAPPPLPSRADESSDWFSSKPARQPLPRGDRDRERDRDAPSKADEVEDWNAGKKFMASERDRDRGGYGFEGRSQDQGWGGGRALSDKWSFNRSEMERWSSESGRNTAEEPRRPRLNLQPRSLPLDHTSVTSSRPSSSHSSRPGTPGDPQLPSPQTSEASSFTAAKPRSNPFGSAKPREMVLEERGQDWRRLDMELDQKRVESKEERKLKDEINYLKDLIDKESSDAAKEDLEKKQLELEQLVKELEKKARVSDTGSRRSGRDDPRRPSSHSNRGGGPEIWRRPRTPSMPDGGSYESGWRRDRPRTASLHEGEMGGYRRGENGRPGTSSLHEEEWRWRSGGGGGGGDEDRPKSAQLQTDMWSRPRTPLDEWKKENGRRSNYHFHHQQQQQQRDRW